jgi:hypothetical protein
LHCKKIIQYLNEHGVDTIAVAAYLDPNNFKKFHTECTHFKKPHQGYLSDLVNHGLKPLECNMSPATREAAVKKLESEIGSTKNI